ncbi:MAG: MFS transporter, partial [Planctomycetes bacterium]|nr:MFS transporter [Planctomycetota bacterium]
STHGKTGGIPWRRILRSGSLWMNSLAQFCTNIGWIFIPMWFPRYLMDVHHVGILERGTMTMIPMAFGWFGMLGGGILTDFMVRKVGLKWGRRIPWGGSRIIGVVAFLTAPYLGTPWAVTIAMSFVAFSTDLGTASGWAYTQDVGGKYVGSVLGWGNMWGNLGATVAPILLAWVFTSYGFDVMFRVCAAAFVIAGICCFGIDATVPIDPDVEPQDPPAV